MGLCHGKADNSINSHGKVFFNKEQGAEYVDDSDCEDEDDKRISGEVYVVICGSNYDSPACRQQGWGPIDQFKSAEFIKNLVSLCPSTIPPENVWTCMGNDMTRQKVEAAIVEAAKRCEDPEDTLFIYYAGHGEQMEDQDGDEQYDQHSATFTGKDQAMCTLNPVTFSPEPRDDSTWFRDDYLVDAIVNNAAVGTKVVACLDCCHSGGMLDCENPKWNGYRAVSISGCASMQVSKGAGQGSFFSHSLSAAYENLQKGVAEADFGDQCFMASTVYNEMVSEFNRRYSAQSEQSLTIRYTGVQPDKCQWPIIPEYSIGGQGAVGKALVYAAPN